MLYYIMSLPNGKKIEIIQQRAENIYNKNIQIKAQEKIRTIKLH